MSIISLYLLKNFIATISPIERVSENAVLGILMNPSDHRLLLPPPHVLSALTPTTVLNFMTTLLQPQNIEVIIVGDISTASTIQTTALYLSRLPHQLEHQLNAYLESSVSLPVPLLDSYEFAQPFVVENPTFNFTKTCQTIEIKVPDDQDRCCVIMAFRGIEKWHDFYHETHRSSNGERQESYSDQKESFSSPSDTNDMENFKHPLHVCRCMNLAISVLNNRLYKRVREENGLVYAVSAYQIMGQLTHAGRKANINSDCETLFVKNMVGVRLK